MLAHVLLTAFIGLFAVGADATALSYKLQPHTRECFFANVEQKGAKVSFYFAVQSGGSFDVDYVVAGPGNQQGMERTILQGSKERQGDYVFTAREPGEHSFCFDNSMSTFADKMVDFEISVENEPRAAKVPAKMGTSAEQTGAVEESVMKISSLLSSIARQQKYFRTRENRNFSTVRSTEARIWNFSVMESGLIVIMALLQVFIVKMFFTGGRKGYV